MDSDSLGSSSTLSFPVLGGSDLNRVAQTISHLFDPTTSSNPALAKHLQQELQQLQSTNEAWGLISGLATHEDPNVRFFSAHTAQVKIARDWDSLPADLHTSLLKLLLSNLSYAINPANPYSYQSGNGVVVRKIFGCLAALILRLPFHQFPQPLVSVLQSISSTIAQATSLPPSAPTSGYNTPGGPHHVPSDDIARMHHRMRLWGLEWCAICVEEIGRAGISDQKRNALKRHLEGDLPVVMHTIIQSMELSVTSPLQMEMYKEAEAACRCAESWVTYGLGGDELTALLPPLYQLLPMPGACSTISEILSESLWKYGKGTKWLTEPLIAWVISEKCQAVLGDAEEEPSDEVVALTKLICALVDHSSEWIAAHMLQSEVQAFLRVILRLTEWGGYGGVDERVSELTLAVFPLIQEALMDSPSFQAPHEVSPDWAIAKSFFRESVGVIQRKARYPEDVSAWDRDEAESFDIWRRDAGEVIVCAYYILRDEMLEQLTRIGVEHAKGASWQDIESTLHCIRYSSEAVPLGEEKFLPVVFGDILDRLAARSSAGQGEERLRLTMVCLIQAYEEWFKFHPEHLPKVLSYLVASLTLSSTISRSAADALKALCDICRTHLTQHIDAFSELHGKIGDLGPEEQTKVIEAITSVIQALAPQDAIGPVEGILTPIVGRLLQNDLNQDDLLNGVNCLAACFKGLSPSDDDIFDLDTEEEELRREQGIRAAREDERMIRLRLQIEDAISRVVQIWQGDADMADSLSNLVKHCTHSSDTLLSLSPLPLLSLVITASERSPSSLWMSLASTLTLRISTPPNPLSRKSEPRDDATQAQEQRWRSIADVAQRLVVVAGVSLGSGELMRDNPDVAESWFKFCSALSARFPGILLRLSTQVIEAYMSLGILGLEAQERFSLKSASDFFVALLASTRFPSPLEPLADPLLKHFGPQILRAVIVSAGGEGPRSVIPNLAELLASLVTRIPGEVMTGWLTDILATFPDPRATEDAKTRLQSVILKSRTAKKMREALHDFALVARGLNNTTYGNATGF